MKQCYRDVLLFHRKHNLKVADTPCVPNEVNRTLRINLLMEEYAEAITALRGGDVASVAKELCDLIYVAVGAAITWGIDLRPVWEEIQASNMTKGVGAKRNDGKVRKGTSYKRPNVLAAMDLGRPSDPEPDPEALAEAAAELLLALETDHCALSDSADNAASRVAAALGAN